MRFKNQEAKLSLGYAAELLHIRQSIVKAIAAKYT